MIALPFTAEIGKNRKDFRTSGEALAWVVCRVKGQYGSLRCPQEAWNHICFDVEVGFSVDGEYVARTVGVVRHFKDA